MAVDQSTERKLGRLRIWNIAVGLILAVQAILVAGLTNSFSPGNSYIYERSAWHRPRAASPVQYLYGLGCFCVSRNIGRFIVDNRFAARLSMVQAQSDTEPQLRALDRVPFQFFHYDRVNLTDHWHQRHCCLAGYLRHQRLYDIVRGPAGEV